MKMNKMGRPGVGFKEDGTPVLWIEQGIIFKSYADAARAVNGHRQLIWLCCQGVQEHHHGEHFRLIKPGEDISAYEWWEE